MLLGPASPGRALSKKQLQRELDLPRARGCVGDLPCRRAETGTRENDLVRNREIGVVENIEGLCPELQIPFLANSELLEKRSVEVGQVRAT